jgi:glycosyltransferase involved in cell wall biosynthesis
MVLPKVVRKARAIIADSHFTKQRLVELLNIDPEKIHVVHLGVSERFRPHSDDELAPLAVEFGLTPQSYFLVVGATEKRKNLERLLKAWRIALERLPGEVKLAVTGPSQLQEQLPPRTVLLGKVGDEYLPALYAGALCNVHVAYYEGFGLPPLEAMASGTPVIAGNRTSLPEVVGDAAIQVDPFSVEAIASALIEVGDSSTLREEFRQKGIRRVREFTWQKTAHETLRVLEQAARL